jgi:UDP-N-acetylmuramate dehydrogenase
VSGAQTFAQHTTMRVGGPARGFVAAATEAELIDAVSQADARQEPVCVLGGGANVVAADAEYPGTVVKVATTGIKVDDVAACSGAFVEVAAGVPLDELVQYAVAHEYTGIEGLSGIPGTVGGAVIQNAGAYGQETGQTLARVKVWDRRELQQHTLSVLDAQLGYRTSRFKAEPDRYLILSASFQFNLGSRSKPIRSAEVAALLGVPPGERAPLAAVREAVLEVRRGKGMVLDESDHDTWSAGSFFTNPVVPAALVPDGAPYYPIEAGLGKTSAAWLIEHAGFAKGYGHGPARLSTKHVLAITNRGGATAADVVNLAREVRDGVAAAYAITLVPEPVFVALSL